MHKKIQKCLIILTAAMLLTSACGKKNADEAEDQEAGTEQQQESTASAVQGSTKEKSASIPVHEEYTWEELEAMNGGENLIFMTDEEGTHLLFLGNKYCEEIIKNEEQALDSLGYISTALGLEDVHLSFYKSDVSPITGNVYYTFYQTAEGEINGQTVDARYFDGLVKVITDSEGHSLGVSSNLVHDSELQYSYDEFVTAEDVTEALREYLDEGTVIYPECTELVYWDDEGTAANVAGGKVIPAYLVYTDAEVGSPENRSGKPYEVYVIAAEIAEDGGLRCVETYYADSLDPEANYGVYTSALYFDGLEDAGEFTYTVNTNWVRESYPEYSGESTREVTVPVMKEKSTGLYYLGSKEKLITCTNAYDFEYYSTLNAYVTEDPTRLDGWHFYDMSCEEDGIKEYFNDPNYVLAAFEVFLDVTNEFEDRYDLPSVDSTDVPLLLEVYATDEDGYPEEVSGFVCNAYNMGQKRDWAVMAVSPALAECLNHTVMGHEYTHGVNAQLTTTQYFNASGAIMESYADIIGAQLSMVNGHQDDIDSWQIGGKYYPQMRSMSEPNAFGQPKYLGGVYYISPISGTLGDELDYGGVHQNSGVCNYLAYCLVNGSDQMAESATLSLEEDLDLWFETLYMTTYISDYFDVGQFLRFAAKCMGLSEEKQEYLFNLLVKFGMSYDQDYEFQMDVVENCREFQLRVNAADSSYADKYDIGVALYNSETGYLLADAGDAADGKELYFRIRPEDQAIPILYVGDNYTGELLSELLITEESRDEYNIEFQEISCSVGDEIVIPGDEYSDYYSDLDDIYDYLYLDEDGNVVYSVETAGTSCISVYDEQADIYRVLCFRTDARKLFRSF